MPAWKVSDEQTASELLSRLGQNTSVYIDSVPAKLDGSDAVILAPTAYKGVTMLITARRRNSTSAYDLSTDLEEPSHYIPEESTSPESIDLALPDETASFEPLVVVEEQPSSSNLFTTTPSLTDSDASAYDQPELAVVPESISSAEVPAEEFFGPTTWERVENAEVAFEPTESSEYSATNEVEGPETPDLTGIPSLPEPVQNAPLANPNAVPEHTSTAATIKPAPERRYVATGFLGLDETVEDEEDLAREKRPWWKKLFID